MVAIERKHLQYLLDYVEDMFDAMTLVLKQIQIYCPQ
jgi:hypothetical protein